MVCEETMAIYLTLALSVLRFVCLWGVWEFKYYWLTRTVESYIKISLKIVTFVSKHLWRGFYWLVGCCYVVVMAEGGKGEILDRWKRIHLYFCFEVSKYFKIFFSILVFSVLTRVNNCTKNRNKSKMRIDKQIIFHFHLNWIHQWLLFQVIMASFHEYTLYTSDKVCKAWFII